MNIRTFYILVLTQTFSLLGSRISAVAIGIWVYEQTNDVTPLALTSFFTVLPMLVAAGVSGVFADRYNRKTLIVLSDTAQAGGTLLLLLSFTSGAFQLWHLYAITLMQAIFAIVQRPAFSASMTMLIPDKQRDRANAIMELSNPAAGIIAPAAAGFIYAAAGIGGAVLTDMVTFLVAVLVILRLKIPMPEQTEAGRKLQGSMWKEMVGGLRYLVSMRVLFFLLLHVSLLNFIASGMGAMLTPYILARTGSAAVLGLVLSVPNIGGLLGGIVFGIWGGTQKRIHTMMIAIMVLGLFMMFFGMARTPLALIVTLFFVMFPQTFFTAPFRTILMTKIAPDVQGRVFAVVTQISILLQPLSFLLIGPLTDKVLEPAVGQPGWELVAPLVGNTPGSGMALYLFGGGLLMLVITIVVYALPAVRRMETDLPDYAPVAAQPAPTPEATNA